MPLNFNSQTDHEKQLFSQTYTDGTFRDHVLRTFINYQDFRLTATQLDTANATPITVLPSPGSGLANLVTGILTYVAAGATPFELGSGTLGYLYTDGSGAAVATAVPNATVESATGVYYWSVPLAVAPLTNAVIVVKPSADITAGDGVIYGRIFYQTVRVADFNANN